MERVKETGIEITVKNAEGDPDTKATIIHQNSIVYEPKVSVIIPVYNTEAYLRECLDSVVNQTLKEIEIICVDDGSTDSSLEILKEYANKDNRFTIITQENLHAGVARNAGLVVAKGMYVHFLDSDDYIDAREAYKKIMDKLASVCYPTIIRFIDCRRFDIVKNSYFEKNTSYNKILKQNKNSFLNVENNYDVISKINCVPWLGFIKLDFINMNNLKFINSVVCNDRSFFKESIVVARDIYLEDYLFITHRANNDFSLVGNRDKYFDCHFKSITKIDSFLSNFNINQQTKRKILIQEFSDLFHWFLKFENSKYYSEIYIKTLCFIKDFNIKKLYPDVKDAWYYRELLKLHKKNIIWEKYKIMLNKKLFKNQKHKLTEFYRKELISWYQEITNEDINLDFPRSLNEKIQWMKLYDSTPIKTQLADKYLVRDWVKEKIGEEYLIPLLGVYDNFNEIDFDILPEQFVIKCNHGCGYNIIVNNKKDFNKTTAKEKIDNWMQEDFGFRFGYQFHYSAIKRKIIVEKFLEEISCNLYDYRFFCCNGKVEQIWLDVGSGTPEHKRKIYDKNWCELDIKVKWPRLETDIPKPKNLEKMIELAEKMSKEFALVRVDFYDVNDKIYFGEMTFTSMSGTGKFEPAAEGVKLGEKIILPELAYDYFNNEYYKLAFPWKYYLQNIFSIKNEPVRKQHKIITILGLKLKIKRKQEGEYSFAEKVFSIKNRESMNNKWYKVITILGVKFKFKNKDLTQRKNILLLNDKIQEQNCKLKEQGCLLKRQDKKVEEQFCKLEELSNKFEKQNNELKKEIAIIKKCTEKQRKELNELNCKYNSAVKRITPQANLKLLEVHITEHCNLNCKCCTHFSPVADEEFLDVDIFEKDCNRLSSLCNGRIDVINLLGGEPLLHSECIRIMGIARNYFPQTKIQLVTNGILLKEMNDYFWQKMSEHSIVLRPTKYPLSLDWEMIKKNCEKHQVKLEFYNNANITKTTSKFVLDVDGKQMATEQFIACSLANNCVQLVNGKLYTCPTIPYIKHFNKHFGYSIPLSERDGIDIHKAESIDEILEFLAKPVPFCKYCNVNGRSYGHKWGTSKKDISEWT